jgi:hypothetical protein
MELLQEIMANPIAVMGIVLTIFCIGYFASCYWNSLFSIPEDKSDQLFLVKKEEEFNGGCFGSSMRTYYLLDYKVMHGKHSQMRVFKQEEETGSNDGDTAMYPVQFSSKELAEAKARELSLKACNPINDDVTTVIL